MDKDYFYLRTSFITITRSFFTQYVSPISQHFNRVNFMWVLAPHYQSITTTPLYSIHCLRALTTTVSAPLFHTPGYSKLVSYSVVYFDHAFISVGLILLVFTSCHSRWEAHVLSQTNMSLNYSVVCVNYSFVHLPKLTSVLCKWHIHPDRVQHKDKIINSWGLHHRKLVQEW